MQRIIDITNIKSITLDNVKVKFTVKLLQYNLNNALYKYNQKFAFPQFVDELKSEITNIVKSANLSEDKEATEVLTKARELYTTLNNITFNYTIEELNESIDTALKYILYNFNKNKLTLSLHNEVDIIQELKTLKDVIAINNIQHTDRIKNSFKLYEQLKNSIIAKL